MTSAPAAVLIDDSIYVRQLWENAASPRNLRIETFANPSTFLVNVNRFSFETPIFVDVSFEEDRDGLELALQLIHIGFQRVYLCTASAGHFYYDKRFAGVISKEIPKWLFKKTQIVDNAG